MAKPKGVVKLRHRKMPHLETHLYEDPEGKVTAHVVNWKKGKVTTFEEKQEGPDESGP